MLLRPSLALVLIAAPLGVVATSIVFADAEQPAATRPADPARAEKRAAHEAMEHAMEAMDRAQKKVEKQLDDPGQDTATLKLIAEMQKSTIDAKNAAPKEVFDLQGDERAKEVVDYRLRMLKLLKTQISLEEAVLRGDRAAAKDVIVQINELRKQGHEEYGVRDKNGNLK